MITQLDKYRKKDKKYLFDRLSNLKDKDTLGQFFSKSDSNKINIISTHGLLSDLEITNIKNHTVELNSLRNLLKIEQSILTSLLDKKNKIDNIFNNNEVILFYKLEIMKKNKYIFLNKVNFFQKAKIWINKNKEDKILESLFVNTSGDIKTDEEIVSEINILEYNFSKINSIDEKILCFWDEIKDILPFNLNKKYIFTYLYEITIELLKIKKEIDEKILKIEKINIEINAKEKSITEKKILRYEAEKEIFLDFFIIGTNKKITRFDYIRKKIEYFNSSFEDEELIKKLKKY